MRYIYRLATQITVVVLAELVLLTGVSNADIDVLCGPEFWENIGGVGAPVWQRNSAWDIPGLTGTYIYPALGDLDNDGDYDLLITKDDNPIIAYENSGSTTNPNWTRKIEWDFYVPGMNQIMSTFLVDLDNDGKIDLMVAKHNTVRAYKNTGTETSHEWTRETDWDIESTGDNNLMTGFADLDADGDYDVLVRNWSDVVRAFENVGSDTSPVWQRKTDWDLDENAWCLCDLDMDGDYDIIGAIVGTLRHIFTYENTGSQTEPIWTLRLDWEIPDRYPNAYLAAVDIDADGVIEETISVEPDQSDSTDAGIPVSYNLMVINNTSFKDVIDITLSGTKPLWTAQLFDSTGIDTLIDHNGNGIVDIDSLTPGDTTHIIVKITPPDSAFGGTIDTTIVRGQCSSDSSIRDEAILKTTVKTKATILALWVEPDRESSIGFGKTEEYPLWVGLEGNISDSVGLTLSDIPSEWKAELYDSTGNNLLVDNNEDEKFDLGIVPYNDSTKFILKVTAPEKSIEIDVVNLETVVKGYALSDTGLSDSAIVTTKLLVDLDVHNYLSPFKDRTTFIFSLPESGEVTITIYNRAGEKIRELIKGTHYEKGIHTKIWDARNDYDNRVSPGVYIYIFKFDRDSGSMDKIMRKTAVLR